MRDWPAKHRNLGVLFILLGIGCFAVFLFVLRPKAQAVENARSEFTEIQGRLRKSGWPLDAERLEKLLDGVQRRLEGPKDTPGPGDVTAAIGIKNKADIVLRDATSMFKPKIEKFFGSTADFMKEASRLDYREEYNQLERRLAGEGIVLAEEVLNLGEGSSSPSTYQLLLQLYTLEAVLDLALESDLRPAKDPNVTVATETNQRGVQAAKLTVLPMRPYFLRPEDKEPYVLEFPVRMTLRGKLEGVCRFLSRLHANGAFFPVTHFEMKTENPALARPDSEGNVTIDRVEIEVECSAFFRPSEKAPARAVKKVKKLPRGA